jgi:hypothetical protein
MFGVIVGGKDFWAEKQCVFEKNVLAEKNVGRQKFWRNYVFG